jgi:cytochrome c biogenesis protein CcdA
MAGEASLLAAFLGGVLSLLSPCSALLLPAFFAYAFGGGRELVRKTGIFYVGLCATLVPLGMGVSAVSSLFYGHRGTLILIAGAVIIAFGVAILLGRGFTVGPLERLRGRVRGDSAGAVFALGATYGFAGFCTGPILGAILTVAAASGGVARGALLLAVYALGMSAPLFFLALLWERLRLGKRRFLRGREVSLGTPLGTLRLHTTNLISGLMFIVLGVVFIAYQGTSALGGLYNTSRVEDLALASQDWAARVSGAVPSWAFVVLLAALAAGTLLRWYFRGDPERPEEPEASDEAETPADGPRREKF